MSADSPRRVGGQKGAQVVSPQPISDKSIIDSMAGIINDIVPQAYTSSAPNSDNRESITWARFEYADVNDPAFFPDYNEGSSIPPLLLVLGYTTGVQVWLVTASGDATEVLSWRQGMVRTLRILPNPKYSDKGREDAFKIKRPMVAVCDTAGPGPHFCSVSFISLKTGEQVKSIKFKSPVCDVLANKRSIVVTFPERIAVFDARTLEDVLTITTCYLSPGPNPNPVALGTRWLAYSEKKLVPGRRSSGGSEGEGVSSYTATVLYAAKSLGKGLRGLGETVASSLTGNPVSPMCSVNNSNSTDTTQPGVITILDLQAAKEEKESDDGNLETVVAHFAAHNDAIVAMTFDQTGALLMTADKRGHDFHVFRIQPHPGGPSLAAVHHLYVLHRGDTTAKVQDMSFSSDARWAAVSTVRGTTHVFPVAPYGGPIGVRTHSSPHVVNRLSRFHKSAGLTDDGTRSHSPVSHTELPLSVYPYTNPRLPPYPHPTILHPLAQIRQPSSLNHINNQLQPRIQQRQRLHSDDSVTLPLKICACFAPPRAWIYAQRDSANKMTKRAVDSLFIMACHGNMIQYDLDPKPVAGVPKEKVCDETAIELEVEAKGQWPLLRTTSSSDIIPPLSSSSLFLGAQMNSLNEQQINSNESRWLSQVEIFTHAGPHRRLWMGPQFVFKTYNAPSGVAANLVEAETVEIGIASGSRPARSNPVNMPHAASRPLVPVVIDGSGSSYEQSPRFVEAYGDALDHEHVGVLGSGENQLREDLAEAMLETSSTPHRVAGRRSVGERVGPLVAKVVNPLGTVITVSADEEDATLGQQETDDDSLTPMSAATITSSVSSSSSSSAGPNAAATTSICAEEGKWLGEREVESQALREHTEICAEMRPANEPAAIDSVPETSIEELKERRTLCAEAAPSAACCAVDLDRVGAFHDVPSSPSLCAERGAVPDCSNVVQPPAAARLKRVRADELPEGSAAAALGLGYQVIESAEAALDLPNPSVAAAAAAASSDDDLEHIDTEELRAVAVPEVPALAPVARTAQVPSSDEDIVHVPHSDVSESDRRRRSGARKRSKEKQRTSDLASIASESKGPKDFEKETKSPELELQQRQQAPQHLGYSNKKTRVRVKRQPIVPTPPDDIVEIINMDAVSEPPEELPQVPPAAPPPPPASLEESQEPFIAQSDMVEIIDIDAEKSSGFLPSQPEANCRILVGAPDILKKKNKHQKKIQRRQYLQTMLAKRQSPEAALSTAPADPPPCETDERQASPKSPEEAPKGVNYWSSVVRRRSNSVVKVEETEECEEPNPALEPESPEDEEEANKEDIDLIQALLDEDEVAEAPTSLLDVNLIAEAFIPKQFSEEETEKKSDAEQEATSGLILVERSSSSDEVNANGAQSNLVVPMETEEETPGHIVRDKLFSTLSQKSSVVSTPMLPLGTAQLPGGILPVKKANRSKKKKRR